MCMAENYRLTVAAIYIMHPFEHDRTPALSRVNAPRPLDSLVLPPPGTFLTTMLVPLPRCFFIGFVNTFASINDDRNGLAEIVILPSVLIVGNVYWYSFPRIGHFKERTHCRFRIADNYFVHGCAASVLSSEI